MRGVTATFLVTPYAFNYDMVAFGWVVIKLMDRPDNDAWDYGLMLAVWSLPFLTVADRHGRPAGGVPAHSGLRRQARLAHLEGRAGGAGHRTVAGAGSSMNDAMSRRYCDGAIGGGAP